MKVVERESRRGAAKCTNMFGLLRPLGYCNVSNNLFKIPRTSDTILL